VIIRPSQKLAKKIKTGTLRELPLDENLLADWSADVFLSSRTQYILISNTKSLYSAVIYGMRITDDSHFIERALAGFRDLMETDGLEFIYHRFIVPATGEVSFAKALNRSVTGSMNDLIRHATYWLADGEMAPTAVANKLNETLMSALARSESFPYGKPREAFRELVDSIGTSP
jgi:hypothetical protein